MDYQYLIWVNALILFFIIGYLLLLRDNPNHTRNRVFLLVCPLLAFLIPLVSDMMTSDIMIAEINLPSVSNAGLNQETSERTVPIIWLLCLAGSTIHLIWSIGKFYRIQQLLKKGDSENTFTFLRRIHIDPKLEGELYHDIRAHEAVHAQQLHSLDLIWYELLRIVFWFNPALWLAPTLLKDIHEYLADEQVNSKSARYQDSLLAMAFGLERIALANAFNSINLKNRIKMMNKKKNKGHQYRWILAIAVLSIASFSFTFSSTQGTSKDKIYELVDEMPRFPGCESMKSEKAAINKCALGKLFEYMATSIKYPKEKEKQGIEGKVLVAYVVDKTGQIQDVKIEKSVDPQLDAEALRVVRAMPKWIPGKQDGKAVSVSLKLPIMFKLDN